MAELLDELKQGRRLAHQRLLGAVDEITDEHLHWRPGPHAPAIAFHLFHTARWADYDRAMMGGGEQIWFRRNLAAAWGLAPVDLGATATGMEIGDEASERLLLPPKPALVSYAEQTFAAFDRFVQELTEEQLKAPTHPSDVESRSIGVALFTHLAHDNRHLGMIEAVRGLLGLKGSVTV